MNDHDAFRTRVDLDCIVSDDVISQQVFSTHHPLEKEEIKAVKSSEMLKMKLKSIPDSDTSPTYDLNVPFFSQGTPEEWIMFVKNLERVFLGQNLA